MLHVTYAIKLLILKLIILLLTLIGVHLLTPYVYQCPAAHIGVDCQTLKL